MKLQGALALVTGGSRGIGKAVAQQLIQCGVEVAIVARGEIELKQVATDIGATPITADLTDPTAVDHIVAEAIAALGRVDLLVNNAALVRPTAVTAMADADLQGEMQCNLLAPMRLVHRLLPAMIERRYGHIVNVSSGAAALPLSNMSNYCASKAGLLHYSASLRAEISHVGIGVTVAELGTVAGTRAYYDALEDPQMRKLYGRLQRVGLMTDTTPEEVAAKIATAVQRRKPYVRVPRAAGLGWALNSLVRDTTYYLFRSKAAG
jgi:3-oxoacyl-[acyl-carrier protein] reductase